MKILIVEDEILVQKSLEKILTKMGHEVETSSSGRKAIEMIQVGQYDKIICDLMLQDITGFDIIEDSKNIYNAEQISNTFAIITAYSSEQVLNRAKDYNCLVLNKPFDSIHGAIRTMIGNND